MSCLLMSGTIDISNLFNYANQDIPSYITKDNTTTNPITDEGATLGRVLFYDKNLSSDNSVSCSSCHLQAFGFSDTNIYSVGINGNTVRRSMRLINSRFGEEEKFFWDERANTLEEQATMPIQDHIEMGYSGENDDPDFEDLIQKLDTISYYNSLFKLAFGDTLITETRIQNALAQFVRSIQSFDSKYDEGRVIVGNEMDDFPNFTEDENVGKRLFMELPEFDNDGNRIAGGAGCNQCHNAPEFDIDPLSENNGVVTVDTSGGQSGKDFTNTRAPSLRDIVDENGNLIARTAMHNGNFSTIQSVIVHYNAIPPFTGRPQVLETVDDRLVPNGKPQRLGLKQKDINQLVAFLATLKGQDVYTNEKWSDPFASDGQLTIEGEVVGVAHLKENPLQMYYANLSKELIFKNLPKNASVNVYTLNGTKVAAFNTLEGGSKSLSTASWETMVYVVQVTQTNGKVLTLKFLKE